MHYDSPWDRGQIDIKLGSEHVIYQNLADFMLKKDIHVNRFENEITDQNIMQMGDHESEF